MSILSNRWAQAFGAVAILAIGFFAYQANSNDDTTEAEVAAEGTETAEGVTTNETIEVVNTIDNTTEATPESENVNSVTETETVNQ